MTEIATGDASVPCRADGLLRATASALGKAGIEPRWTEARMIFALAGIDAMALVQAPSRFLDAQEERIIRLALARRLDGMPIARLRGSKDFAGSTFALSAGTLEPRDDTEALIEAVKPFLARRPSARILDIGTGTGIIAITLLKLFPAAHAVATDISADALATAADNARHLGVGGRLTFIHGDMFAGAAGPFDVIISNPPYIPSADIAGLDREVRDHDPVAALDGGADGLDFYRRIAIEAGSRLADSGAVAVEIGFDQAKAVSGLFADHGFAFQALHRDLGGRDRALVFTTQAPLDTALDTALGKSA
jgi:release factor glutamine methyltransferase